MAPAGEPTYDGPSQRPRRGQFGNDVMAKKFDGLRKKMSPDRQARNEAEAKRMLAGLAPEVSHTITILRTDGCRGAPEAERLARSLGASRRDVTVEVVLVADGEQAVALGFRGSPTVLVDGMDVEPSPEIPLGSMA